MPLNGTLPLKNKPVTLSLACPELDSGSKGRQIQYQKAEDERFLLFLFLANSVKALFILHNPPNNAAHYNNKQYGH